MEASLNLVEWTQLYVPNPPKIILFSLDKNWFPEYMRPSSRMHLEGRSSSYLLQNIFRESPKSLKSVKL